MTPYVIRSFRGGISDENDKGIPGSFKFGYGLDIHSRDDVLRPASASVTVLDSTTGETGAGSSQRGTTLNSHFVSIVPSFDGSTYFFGRTGSIFARSADGFWTNIYNDDEGITGAGEFGLSDGATYMFWGKSTSIARRQMGGTFDSARDSGQAIWSNATQVWKTEKILSSAVWRTMQMASGALMMANGEGLSVLDFNENFAPLKLNIRPGNIINTLEERDDNVILGTERLDESENGYLWSWVVTALNWVQKKRIPVQGINALITAESPLLQGGSQGEIFPADFYNSIPLATVPGAGSVIPGGVAILEDVSVFGFSGGTYPGIWSYGRRNKNRSSVLNYQYRLSPTVGGSLVATIGAISVINGTLFASWGTTESDTSVYGVDAISSTARANAVFEGLEFDKGAGWDERMVSTVHLVTSPLIAGTSISIKYKVDKQASWQYAVFGDGSTTFAHANETEIIGSIGKPAHIFEVGVELNSSGADSPEAHEITTYLGDEKNAY